MAQHVVFVLLSDAHELEADGKRSDLIEALRPLHSAQNALGSEAPVVTYTEQGHGNATVALAVELPESDDLQAHTDDVLRRIGQHTAGHVDATEIVRIDEA